MKTSKWTVLLFLMPLFLLSACVEKPIDVKPRTLTLPISNLWQCHNDAKWDSTKIVDKLVGQWKWRYTTAGSEPNFVDKWDDEIS